MLAAASCCERLIYLSERPAHSTPRSSKRWPLWASAHRCQTFVQPLGFSKAGGIRLDSTIPISFSESTVSFTAEHVIQARESLGRPILVEPIAAPLRIPGSLKEAEFLKRLCHKAECRLLVDLSTLLIESRNRASALIAGWTRYPQK